MLDCRIERRFQDDFTEITAKKLFAQQLFLKKPKTFKKNEKCTENSPHKDEKSSNKIKN